MHPDIDECAQGDSGCSQICVNTPGSYYCTCELGFAPNGLTKTVQEVDTHVNTTLLIIILSLHCRDMPATSVPALPSLMMTVDRTPHMEQCTPLSSYDLQSSSSMDTVAVLLCMMYLGLPVNTEGSFYCTCRDGYQLFRSSFCIGILYHKTVY